MNNISKDILTELYIDKKYSTRKIAKMLNKSNSFIFNQLILFNIETRKRNKRIVRFCFDCGKKLSHNIKAIRCKSCNMIMRNKISGNPRKGVCLTNETKEKIRHKLLGRKLTEEQKNKISLKNKKRFESNVERNKASLRMKKVWLRPGFRENQVIKQKRNIFTDDHRKKISLKISG